MENSRNGGSGKLHVSDYVVGRNGGKLSVDACSCICACMRIVNVALSVAVCGSAHCCGCTVNHSIAKAAFQSIHIFVHAALS